jgi:hypothetical protein
VKIEEENLVARLERVINRTAVVVCLMFFAFLFYQNVLVSRNQSSPSIECAEIYIYRGIDYYISRTEATILKGSLIIELSPKLVAYSMVADSRNVSESDNLTPTLNNGLLSNASGSPGWGTRFGLAALSHTA